MTKTYLKRCKKCNKWCSIDRTWCHDCENKLLIGFFKKHNIKPYQIGETQ
jgi:hypothetical protein